MADSCVRALVEISDESCGEMAENSAGFGRWQQPSRLQEENKEMFTGKASHREINTSLLVDKDQQQGMHRGMPLPNCASVAAMPRKRPDIMIRRRVHLSRELPKQVPLSISPAISPQPEANKMPVLAELLARKPPIPQSTRNASFTHLAIGKSILSLSSPSTKQWHLPNQASFSLLLLKSKSPAAL